jgi:hypothetical protein
MNQLVFFPVWNHDDFPDVIEKGISYISSKIPGEFLAGKGGSLSGVKGNVKSLAGSLKSGVSW